MQLRSESGSSLIELARNTGIRRTEVALIRLGALRSDPVSNREDLLIGCLIRLQVVRRLAAGSTSLIMLAVCNESVEQETLIAYDRSKTLVPA